MQTDCFPGLEIPWDKAHIASLAVVQPRYPVHNYSEYPFVEMAAVAENFGGIQNFEWRKPEGCGLSRFRVNDTLFAKITPCPQNGKVAFVSNLPAEQALGSTEFIVLSPKENCHPRFLYHLVCCHEIRGRAVARMEGSTGRQRVPEEVFTKRLLVPIPDPEEQSAIAKVLDAVDTAIERTREAIDRAREVKRALVQDLFSKGIRGEDQKKTAIGFVPRSWDVVEVDSVVDTFQYGLSVPMELKGTVPILRMGNIQSGEVLLDGLKFVSLPDKIISPYRLMRGDVLFNRTNSQELVGKVGIYRHDEPAVFASYLIRVVPKISMVDNYYLGQLLNSHSTQCRIKRYATPGVQQVNINATNLGKVLIPLPVGKVGLEEQKEIAQILEEADTLIRGYGPVLEAQNELKKSLMYDLLTGQKRVTALLEKSEVGVA